MKTVNLVLIGVCTILAVILIDGWYNMVETQKTEDHNKYCRNWYQSLEEEKKQLESVYNPDTTQYDSDRYQYNKECYY